MIFFAKESFVDICATEIVSISGESLVCQVRNQVKWHSYQIEF